VASACSTCVWNSDGSSRASTCPFRTRELKSACSELIVPDTWEPTATVVTACSVPVASTRFTTGPLVTRAVVKFGCAVSLDRL
jgi:hypothetical protein